jgi:hypothetical protein
MMKLPGGRTLRTSTDHDPLTLPVWRKVAMVITAALAAFQGNYAAGAHLIAFGPMSAYYGVSIAAIANTIGIGILGIGLGPLLWSPLASPTALGRRNTFLLAWTIYVPLTLWLSFAKSFNSFAAARFLSMFFASAAQTLPAQQIGETFDRRYKGTAMSTWALFMTAGPVSTSLVGAGLLKLNPGPEAFRNIYYFVAVTSFVVWVLIVLFIPETAYLGESHAALAQSSNTQPAGMVTHSDSVDKEEKGAELSHHNGDVSPVSAPHNNSISSLKPWYYAIPDPLYKFLDARVFLCALLFAITFGWTVGLTILNPQVFEKAPWSFDSVKIGAVYMGALIGAVVGKLLGGYVVDVSLIRWRNRSGLIYPEQRLWALLAFLPFGIIGLLCYGYGIGQKMSWPVAVVVGQGFFYFFFNIVSSTTQTYVVEVEPYAANSVICFMNFVKCVYAFGAPFFITEWALPSGHAFEVSFIVQMVVNVVICLLVVSLATFLRNGVFKGKPQYHADGKRQLAMRVAIGP